MNSQILATCGLKIFSSEAKTFKIQLLSTLLSSSEGGVTKRWSYRNNFLKEKPKDTQIGEMILLLCLCKLS